MSEHQNDSEQVVVRVLGQYAETASHRGIECLHSAGGFSGSELWRIKTAHGSFCLRRWPQEFDVTRLVEIHSLLRGVFELGVREIAAPLATRDGTTVVREQGASWELTPWMPGSADFHQAPSAEKRAAAMRFLARFHLASAMIRVPTVAMPPGIVARKGQLHQLMAGGFSELRRVVQTRTGSVDPGVGASARQFLESFPRWAPRIMELLTQAEKEPVQVQVCIRDIWHDHVLFTNHEVTGVVDFGAMRPDHVGSDISRLLGSLARNDPAGWAAGTAAYVVHKPLTEVDRHLVKVYHDSGILLGAMNWLHWLFVEGRQFPDPARVRQRCAELATCLHHGLE